MSEDNALAVRSRDLTPSVSALIQAIAPIIYRSRLFGVASVEQAATIMLTGYTLGFSPVASFQFIHVIKGKPSLSPRGALALLHGHHDCAGIRIEDLTDEKGNARACRVWMKRRNDFEYTTEFSLDDARRAGLVKADSGWSKYPANMLRWRAVGFCADVVFPDILAGMKRSDEFGAPISPDGDVIDGEWQDARAPAAGEPAASPPAPQAGEQAVEELLATLINQYGPEAVVRAGGGEVPSTMSQLEQAMAALIGS